MKLFTLKINEIEDFNEFLDYWSELYKNSNDYAKEVLYTKHINKNIFTEEEIKDLYEWKNQMILSGKKEESLKNKILIKIDKINEYKQLEKLDLDEFLNEFKDVSAVWKIFLLHIIKPNSYPIYDQHVHRCYCLLHNLTIDSINSDMNDSEKIKFYKEDYLPFIREISNNYNLKIIDEAFVSLGQFFASTQNKRLI